MRGILFQYELNPTTWVYLSSLIVISVYFKFRRVWSVRNLDLLAVIGLSPGLLLVYHGLTRQLESQDVPVLGQGALSQLSQGQWLEQFGYVWLFTVGAFFLVRLLLDAIVVRRPLLEPNLSAGGLTFTGAALLIFLMSNVVNPNPLHRLQPVKRLEHVLAEQRAVEQAVPSPEGREQTLLDCYTYVSQRAVVAGRTAAVLGHLAVVLGLVLIGYRHFGNIQTGVAVATLYLLLPYTSQMTSRADHVVPAALLVWAVEAYRRPVVAGILIGLACGVIYPLSLLPLWCGFYWRRGLYRFIGGIAVGLIAAFSTLLLALDGWAPIVAQFRQMFWTSVLQTELAGFWRYREPVFRMPVMAAFVAVCSGLALWPAQKNLGTLLSCSAAVMLGSQFWQAQHGGLYMAWYLPLLLLTVFRPNLEDRVAITALTEGWLWWGGGRSAAAETPSG